MVNKEETIKETNTEETIIIIGEILVEMIGESIWTGMWRRIEGIGDLPELEDMRMIERNENVNVNVILNIKKLWK